MYGGLLKTSVLLAALSAHSAVLAADPSWNCRNEHFEITCGAGDCQATEAFTPMDVTLGPGAQIVVCAYSGCWEGAAQIQAHGPFISYHGLGLAFSSASDPTLTDDIAVLLDTSDKIALVKAAGFAHPMICEQLD